MTQEIKNILKECQLYIDALKACPKGYFLYRGSKLQIPEFKKFDSHLNDRRPLHNSQDHHDRVNEIFQSQFGWKIRNGVFCYGSTSLNTIPIELGYGIQFLFFPIEQFSFVYNPEHFDLFEYFYNNPKATDDDINKLIFKNDSLEEAITSGKHPDGISNEISVNVSSFYLINLKYRDEIVSEIWG
jgi:hypothetical protein